LGHSYPVRLGSVKQEMAALGRGGYAGRRQWSTES